MKIFNHFPYATFQGNGYFVMRFVLLHFWFYLIFFVSFRLPIQNNKTFLKRVHMTLDFSVKKYL